MTETTTRAPKAVFVPMLCQERVMERIDELVADDAWVLEQKLDGVRLMCVITPGHVDFLGAGGGTIKFAAATQHFPDLRAPMQKLLGFEGDRIVLDGELMIDTGEYHVFDLVDVHLNGQQYVDGTLTLAIRRAMLAGLSNSIGELGDITNMRIIAQAAGAKAKRELVERVTQTGGEGFVAKRLDGRYVSGGRTPTWLKVKFVHTADVIVTAMTRGTSEIGRETGSARLAVRGKDAALVDVGNCSLIGKGELEVGDVIEVAFMAFRGAMVQPRMLRRRPDKVMTDCTIDQFKAYSKAVV